MTLTKNSSNLDGMNSNVLKYVSVPLITNEKCLHPYTNYPSNYITSNMVCAGLKEGGKDSCSNDSGGPLVVPRSSSDASAIIYGIVSFGGGCAQPDQPGVYARVAKYLDWIQSYMNGQYQYHFNIIFCTVNCFYLS